MARQREEGLGFLAPHHCSIDSWAPSKLSKEGFSMRRLLCSSNPPGNVSKANLDEQDPSHTYVGMLRGASKNATTPPR